MWTVIIIFVVMALLIGVVFLLDTVSEVKQYNSGFCTKCGSLLKWEENTSNGNQIFVCPKCGHQVVIAETTLRHVAGQMIRKHRRSR